MPILLVIMQLGLTLYWFICLDWIQVDFKPVVLELLATHPGLEFLKGTPEFQERYGMCSLSTNLITHFKYASSAVKVDKWYSSS